MKNRFILSATLLFIGMNLSYSQSAHDYLLEADRQYLNGQYEKAEELYRKASEKGELGKAEYNLANTLIGQERIDEAINQYRSATMSSDKEIAANAYYNLGNAYVQNEKLQEGVEAYKNALRLNENDQQAKENLMMAKQMIKQMQQQEQQQQQNQDDQDQSEDQEQQQQEQQEQQDQQNQQQDQQQDQQQGEDQQPPQDESAEPKTDLNKEDAEKLLEIVENEEQKVQERLRKTKANSKKPKKDW